MERSAIALLVLLGMTIGGFVPELWGASGISVSALLLSALGGLGGVWLGARLSAV